VALFTQEGNRLLTIGTPLGADVLLLVGFNGKEEISRLYTYQLDILSEHEDINPQDIVGQNVTWVVSHVDKEPRSFNGYVSRFSMCGFQIRGMRAYRAEVVPWLWFLSRTTNCRIFQNQSTPQIIQTVFGDLGFTDFRLALQGTYPPREYCVQYRETAFDFVSRLMEEDGIFYFFKHENGKHTLVLADSSSVFQDVAETPVSYGQGTLARNHIATWEHQYAFGTGRWTQTDYNFKTPGISLLSSTDTVVQLPNLKSFEKFDYPGLYQKRGDGNTVTRTRMQEEEAGYDVARGASQCCTFTPGGKFMLQDHRANRENKRYVLTAVQHTAREVSYEQQGGVSEYKNSFTCIPDTVAFRPPRVTPKPFVQGIQTAVVVGPPGEEIFTDQYGRVKVQFFWDRLGKSDDNSSCWIRVAQNWAGKNWGLIANPRIGQEVVVDFLEGDPDRPLITGRVYNADQMPIYPLPANQTQTGIKTRSSKGGSVNNFNELRFEDKKGSEEVYFHAEKDFNRVVENNDSLIVGSSAAPDGSQTIQIWKNRSELVQTGDESVEIAKGNRTHKIKQNDNLTVEGNQTISVTQNRNEIVKSGNETVVIAAGSRNHNVKQNDALIVEGSQTIQVTQDHTRIVKSGNETIVVATGNRSHSVKGNDTLVVSGNQSQEITGNLQTSVTTGNQTISIASGSFTLGAATAIELRVGASAIRIDPTGVSIEGPLVHVTGGALAKMSAPVAQVSGLILDESALLSSFSGLLVTIGGLVTTVSGLALATLGGALTLIGPPGGMTEAALVGLDSAEQAALAVAPVVATEAAGGTVTPEQLALMALGLAGAAAGPAALVLKPRLAPLAKAAMGKARAALNSKLGGLLSKCAQKAAVESEIASNAAKRANALTKTVSTDEKVLRDAHAASTAGQRSTLHTSAAAKLAAGHGPGGLSPAKEAARAAQSAKAFSEATQAALKTAPREAVLEAEKAAQSAEKAAAAAKNAERIARLLGPPTKAERLAAKSELAAYKSSIRTPLRPAGLTPPKKPLPPTPPQRMHPTDQPPDNPQPVQPKDVPIEEAAPLSPSDLPQPKPVGETPPQRLHPSDQAPDNPQPVQPKDVPIEEAAPLSPSDLPQPKPVGQAPVEGSAPPPQKPLPPPKSDRKS
jgi:type VI secretion system secreted protein VgrG